MTKTTKRFVLNDKGVAMSVEDVPQTISFTVAEYSKALSKLPMHYLCLEYTELKHVVFQGQIIVANGMQAPMIFHNGKWDEMSINTEHGMVIHDPSR